MNRELNAKITITNAHLGFRNKQMLWDR